MNEPLSTTSIGEIVATDFRTAAIFEQFGIDFCCGGRRPLDEACRMAAADPSEVVRALEALPPPLDADVDGTRWPVSRLIDHIVSQHHAYVRAAIPAIRGYLGKLVAAHGVAHPELNAVAAHFNALAADLEQHLVKEELVLFRYIRELANDAVAGRRAPSPFGTVENPIRMMEREHRDAADELQAIRELTNGYTTPEDGCTTYAVCMAMLEQFERDLHQHVHLENNVLFSKAIALEGRYQAT